METSTTLSGFSADSYRLPQSFDRIQRLALIIGGVAALICVWGFVQDRDQFLRSYLVGYIFWLLIALGCLGWTMINHLTAGKWGIVLRRGWEAGSRTLHLLVILLLPFLFGMGSVFSWARPEAAEDELIQAKAAYLSVDAFWLRVFLYFGVWILLSFLLTRNSARQDETGDPQASRRLRNLSGPGIVLYVAACSVFSWDWLMSLDPHWFSSLYGMYFVAMTALSALLFSCVLAWLLNREEPMRAVFKPKYFHDQGKLALALIMFWAYMALSQFLITWSGNVPEFVTWYIHRNNGGWKAYSVLLILLHFFVPFAILLSASLKKQPGKLAAIALFLLFMQWVDLYWQAAPIFYEEITVHFFDFVTLVAVGGLWIAVFIAELKRRTILPINDPHITEVLGHG